MIQVRRPALLVKYAVDLAMEVREHRGILYGSTPEMTAESLTQVRRRLNSDGVRFDETPNSITLRNGSRIDFVVLGECVDAYEDQADGA